LLDFPGGVNVGRDFTIRVVVSGLFGSGNNEFVTKS